MYELLILSISTRSWKFLFCVQQHLTNTNCPKWVWSLTSRSPPKIAPKLNFTALNLFLCVKQVSINSPILQLYLSIKKILLTIFLIKEMYKKAQVFHQNGMNLHFEGRILGHFWAFTIQKSIPNDCSWLLDTSYSKKTKNKFL